MTVVGVVGRVKQVHARRRLAHRDVLSARAVPRTRDERRAAQPRRPGRSTAAPPVSIRGIDPDLPMYRVRTMTERVEESLARRRFSMLLLTLFAALALGLASDRHLRRDGVSGEPGHARARHPSGARRDAAGAS